MHRNIASTEMNDLLPVNLKATTETKPNKWKMASKNEPPMDAMEGKVTDSYIIFKRGSTLF